MKAKDKLTCLADWTQGAAARDRFGLPCSPESKRAVSYCILGVLMRVYEADEWESAVGRVMKAIWARGWKRKSLLDIAAWNNHPSRTFEEVRQVIEKADV
jgi:hypothetical protein